MLLLFEKQTFLNIGTSEDLVINRKNVPFLLTYYDWYARRSCEFVQGNSESKIGDQNPYCSQWCLSPIRQVFITQLFALTRLTNLHQSLNLAVMCLLD